MMIQQNRLAFLGLVLLCGVSAVGQENGQATARDYYKELHDAGGLDRMADRYVCFQDDGKAENFFIFAESKYLLQYICREC